MASGAHAPAILQTFAHTGGKTMKSFYYNPTRTEAVFQKLYQIYPENLFIYLYQQGFSRKAFKGIQSEMDRIYQAEKRGFTAMRQDVTTPFT